MMQLKIQDESELLKKIKADPSEFADLFNYYYKPIFGYVFRRTGDFDEAADVTAETFLKAFTHIKRFTYKGISIKVWLYRIATNEVNQYYRKTIKYKTLFQRLEFREKDVIRESLDKDRTTLEEEFYKHEQFNMVLNALKTLPHKYQSVIALRYFEDKRNPEISEILNLKEGTVKSLISRGLKKLKEKCSQI